MIEKQRQKPKDVGQLQKGDLITYLLPPSPQVVNPLRQWHGCVELTAYDLVKVTVLDEGYEGCTEYVRQAQIIAVAPAEKKDMEEDTFYRWVACAESGKNTGYYCWFQEQDEHKVFLRILDWLESLDNGYMLLFLRRMTPTECWDATEKFYTWVEQEERALLD